MKLANGVEAINLHEVNPSFPSTCYMDEKGHVWWAAYEDRWPIKMNADLYLSNNGYNFDYNDLCKQAMQSEIWKKTFKVTSAQGEGDDVTTPIKGGYVIATIEGGFLVFGSIPRVYATIDEANEEIERLACSRLGKTFVLLKIEQFIPTSDLN